MQLNEKQKKLARRLVDTLLNKKENEKPTIIYGDVMREYAIARPHIGHWLGEISMLCHTLGLPLLLV